MLLMVLMLVTVSGCATATAPVEGDIPVHGSTGYRCDAAPAQRLVGQPAANDLGIEAQRLSGAGAVRWIRPGDMVTMDYREDRLNIHLDERHRVARLTCG